MYVAVKDKTWELVGECKSQMAALEFEIREAGRSRDKASPPRPIDERPLNRYGRRAR